MSADMGAPRAQAELPASEEARERSAYAVKLPTFEGPLDLLLHLIRQNEVEITDIPISRIADQYLATVELMHELNLEVASDYLVVAATLAWIKSRMLLPPTGLEGDEEGVDPRAELVARLLEYQRFREVADQLGERPLLGRDVYALEHPEAEPTPEGEREIEVSLVALVDAFRRVLERVPEGPGTHEVTAEEVTVRERMFAVMESLAASEYIEFERIFDGREGLPTRAVVIATFLAVLELVRIGAIRVYQGLSDLGHPQGPIRLRRAGEDPEAWRSAISEWT